VFSAAVLTAGIAGIVLDLEQAAGIASVVGAVAGLAGVAVAVVGLALGRRQAPAEQSISGTTVGGRVSQRIGGATGRQTVTDSDVGGDLDQRSGA
jgi:hypothetical protein